MRNSKPLLQSLERWLHGGYILFYIGSSRDFAVNFGAKVMFESLIKQDIAFFDGTMTGLSTAGKKLTASHWCLQ